MGGGLQGLSPPWISKIYGFRKFWVLNVLMSPIPPPPLEITKVKDPTLGQIPEYVTESKLPLLLQDRYIVEDDVQIALH